MSESSSREAILQKIRKALTQSTPLPFPQTAHTASPFHQTERDLALLFAEEFSKLQGKFAFCLDAADLARQLSLLLIQRNWTKIFCNDPILVQLLGSAIPGQYYHTTLAACDASITSCEGLVARTGSVVLSAAGDGGRTVSVYAPVHICIAYTSQLCFDVSDSLQALQEKYGQQLPSLISFATGPSRTADIEKTLVTGVHGPREVFVFLVDQPSSST